ncbi:MAG TPA: ABC transporter ATP-binding protein [Thermotogota bacterium]|nr:ABC transporter ATP-binding protein [Thermotogota bacterium]HRW91947.1 ABC transporter ATP-binding protein [Thermotogota bacterium]
MAFISVQNLKKVYSSGRSAFEALKGLDFDIHKGEILSILGPSGCGKSTLLNCLSGIDDPTEGKVLIDGVDLHALADDKKTLFRAEKMGFVFQFYNLIPVLSAVENVEMPVFALSPGEKKARTQALDVLKRLGMEDRCSYFPSQLSGGERQRVSIARALVHRPQIIWADEPTGALDTQTGEMIMDLLLDLNRSDGLTFVIVTHDERIARYSDRILRMDSGTILGIEQNARARQGELP